MESRAILTALAIAGAEATMIPPNHKKLRSPISDEEKVLKQKRNKLRKRMKKHRKKFK